MRKQHLPHDRNILTGGEGAHERTGLPGSPLAVRYVRYCERCLMPDTRPRVVFTDGVCNACLWAEQKKSIDWQARADEFKSLFQPTGSAYDCIVPFSGGKDSAMIAYRLKYEHGLNPLLVTYGQLLWTDVGRRNFDRVCDAGFDILYWRVNQNVSRKLARRFMFERGHPKQHYDAGVNTVPLIAAVRFNIPLVFYAEHGDTEYGGLVLDEESRRTRNLTEVLEHCVGDDPRNWATNGISEADLAPYLYPSMDDMERVGVKAFYYSYFFNWDIYQNALDSQDKLGFERAQNGNNGVWGKSDGSFEGFDSIDDKIDDLDYYMMHVKFGFGRATRMASRLIQNGHLTRAAGLELVRRYDGEYPESYLPDVLEYLEMTKNELDLVVCQHRNPELWDGHTPRFYVV